MQTGISGLTQDKQTPTGVFRWGFLAGLFGYMLLMRLMPYLLKSLGVSIDPTTMSYPWNFSPALAICLFGGAFFPSRLAAVVWPLLTFFVGDLGIWLLSGHRDWAFHSGTLVVYVSVAACTALGMLLRNRVSFTRTVGVGFASCTLFYLVTNFAVWAFMSTYPHTWHGLLECYVAAIPFYRNSLAGTAFYGAILFSPLGIRLFAPQVQTPAAVVHG